MPDKTDYENRQIVLAQNICNLLCDLSRSTYDEIKPKLEFWIDYVLDERLATATELADRVLPVAWNNRSSGWDISPFLKEFRNAPHRSKQARSFVDELCSSILRWFSVASSEELWDNWSTALVSKCGGPGFLRVAWFVGHLVQFGLIDRKLVQHHIFKPLTAHYYNESNFKKQAVRAHAIYRLFETGGNTLLRGLLEPEEVQDCFKKLEIRVTIGDIGDVGNIDKTKLNEFREIHAKWLQEESQRNVTTAAVPAPGETDIPDTAPQNPPSTYIGANCSPFDSRSIEPLSMPWDDENFSDTLIDARVSTASSPTLSASTISDLTPTELDTGESSGENTLIRHETFYLEDGNVEIVCGHTVFRIHSSIVSFSSSKLRGMFSPPTLRNTRTLGGCPRILSDDSAEDFAILLKMISTPGFPACYKVPKFAVFASLLRMATKYLFSDVREQLLHSLKGAYPTKLEAYRTASVLGEDVFGSPKPHPNLVLNLFLEQSVRFAIPVAAYRAALGGFSSLIRDEPGMVLPRLTLASIFYGTDMMQSEMSKCAHSIACSMSLEGCGHEGYFMHSGVYSREERMEGVKKIYEAIVKGGKGDVLSSLTLPGEVCMECGGPPRTEYDRLHEKIWENLPRIFRVGKSWEEL